MVDLRDKKILVTGGAGFLGSHVVRNIIDKRGVDPQNIVVPRLESCDLRVPDNCKRVLKGVKIVIHLAAKVGGIGFNQKYPGEIFFDNIMMGIPFMELARHSGVEKFVGIGTICEYPKFTPVPFKEDNLWMGYPEETNAPYGLAKKMLLVQAQAYRVQYGFNAIHLLPVNLYGPGDNFDPQSSHVIPALIKKIREAKLGKTSYVEIWGTGNATREFLYIEDAAEGIVLATEKYNKPEPVNLGSGVEISIKDAVSLISRLMNYSGIIKWDSSKPDGQPRRILDITKAEKEFGFKSGTNFVNGLRKTIDWYESKVVS
jgi:GDP-L-fucose synthase